MCIYLGNSPELTYRKQEHVFPASLGGKQKLLRGTVSDKANETFSPLELQLTRQSLIAFDRMMFGPGKRGSQALKKAAQSAVNVGLQNDGQPVLCYTAMGKPYNIPQFHIHDNTVTLSVPYEQSDGKEQMLQFLSDIKEFSEKHVFLKSQYVLPDDILIGYYDKKYFVATNSENPSLEEIKRHIDKLTRSFEMQELHYGEYHAKQTHRLCENSEIARMYAKVAMNVLAHLKGEVYACHSNFDDIRKWIISGESSIDYFSLPDVHATPNTFLMEKVPDQSHWCILTSRENDLVAAVCFYNSHIRYFNFGKLPDELVFFPDGFICDWKNNNEYTLIQFIDTITVRESELDDE